VKTDRKYGLKSTVLYLAPLRGLTDVVFRNAFSRHFEGFDLAVAPFISTRLVQRVKPSALKDVLPENNKGLPVVPQLMSKDPEEFIIFANALFDLGYETVNWNLGCPYPMVAKKKRGSGLLEYPEMIASFLDKTVPAIPNRLSIKTRLGRKKVDEIYRLIPIFNQYPIEDIIIHPRTGIQMYDGVVDIEAFENCLKLCKHPVVYNGDITEPEKLDNLRERFPEVRAWMIGRGAIANPFLSGTIKYGDIYPEKERIMKLFIDDLFRGYREKLHGPSHPMDRMKGFWGYFAKLFDHSEKFLKSIRKTRQPEEYQLLVDRFFQQDARWIGAGTRM
jgi:tRNA-dihydrouridine synthase B